MSQPSQRARSIEPFLAMEVLERAQELERAGADVIHLEIGEPEFPAPAAAVEAARRALADEPSRYTDSRGLLELREAIARDHARRSGVAVDPARVLVAAGTSPALLLAFTYLLDPGDEVVLGTPHYACYPNLIRAAGGVPVFVETRADGRLPAARRRRARARSRRARARSWSPRPQTRPGPCKRAPISRRWRRSARRSSRTRSTTAWSTTAHGSPRRSSSAATRSCSTASRSATR